MEKYFEVLSRCPLFAQVTRSEIGAMLHCLSASVEHYEKDAVILAEGASADRIGIVLNGSAQTVMNDYDGNRSILFTAGPGMLFCESFACAGAKEIPVEVTADEPTTVMFVNFGRMIRTCGHNCAHHQQMIYNMMRTVAAENIRFHEKIEIISKRTTRDKLLTYLTQQSKKYASDSFFIPYDRQELADYLAVDRSGLSAEISKLKKEGLLDTRKNHFTLNLNR